MEGACLPNKQRLSRGVFIMKLGETFRKNKTMGEQKLENKNGSRSGFTKLQNKLRSLWICKLVATGSKSKQQKGSDFDMEAGSDSLMKLCLTSQGTTANFYLGINFMLANIDGRETYGNKYIVEENLKKYEMYGAKVLVAFVGDVRTGRGVLNYLRELMESKKPKNDAITVDLLSKWTRSYIPTNNGVTDIITLGFSTTGVPLVSHLVFTRSGRGLKVDEVSHINEDFMSLGSGEENENLRTAINNLENASPEHISNIFGAAMAKAVVRDFHSGGLITTLHMHFRGRRVQINSSTQTSISNIITYFDHWVRNSMLFLLYPREMRDLRFFHRWICKQLGCTMAMVDFRMSTIAKLQSSKGELAFAVVNLLPLKKYASFMIENGKENKHLLSGFEVSEYQSKYESNSKDFYFMTPSLDFLRTTKFEYIDEYALAEEEQNRKS